MLEEYELLNDELEKRNEELNKKIDEQAKVIQWYEKENRHNQEIIIKDIKEIERLNNIINEIEKESYLGRIENQKNNDYSKGLYTAYKYINDKIKELKGSDKE